jgi:hypothetical protein
MAMDHFGEAELKVLLGVRNRADEHELSHKNKRGLAFKS